NGVSLPKTWVPSAAESDLRPASTRKLGMEQVEHRLHPVSCFGGNLENLHPGPNALYVAPGRGQIELRRLGQVHLGDDGNIGGIENGGVFQRLILALGCRPQKEPQLLSQVVARGTNQ